MIRVAFSIASAIRYRPNEPARDRNYLRWIRRFPCVGCGSCRWIEAMHVGPHGIGQKASDFDALPGCPACHRTGPKALHKIGPVDFQTAHGISFPDLIRYFNGLWRETYPRDPVPCEPTGVQADPQGQSVAPRGDLWEGDAQRDTGESR